MADVNEFYSYRSTIRADLSSYFANSSLLDGGSQTSDKKIELAYINTLEPCSRVMEKFDPTSLIHLFTADEMRDFMRIINDILNTNYNVNFEQYYA